MGVGMVLVSLNGYGGTLAGSQAGSDALGLTTRDRRAIASIDQAGPREALLDRNLCDERTAVSICEVCQEIWEDATRDFASKDKIAVAIADLKSSLLEATHENERVFSAQLLEMRRETDVFRREQAERDAGFWREIAERDARLRREVADRADRFTQDQERRDTRFRWLVGLGFTDFGVLASCSRCLLDSRAPDERPGPRGFTSLA